MIAHAARALGEDDLRIVRHIRSRRSANRGGRGAPVAGELRIAEDRSGIVAPRMAFREQAGQRLEQGWGGLGMVTAEAAKRSHP